MAKIFDVQSDIHESPNRNNHDLMHKRHMTGKFGYIYPFLSQPVVPTDEWEIDTAIGVNLMPMWYPTQTNMRFIVHYFFVPYRIMYKDWKNYSNGLDDNAVLPYHDVDSSWFKTGTLADYLGIPTNFVTFDGFDLVLQTQEARTSPYFTQVRIHDVVYARLPQLVGDSYDTGAIASTILDFNIQHSNSWSNASGLAKAVGFPVLSPIAPIKPTDTIFPDGAYIRIQTSLTFDVSSGIDFKILFFGSQEELPLARWDTSKLRLIGLEDFGSYTNYEAFNQSHSFQASIWNHYVSLAPYVYVVVVAVHPNDTVGISGITNTGSLVGYFGYKVPEGFSLSLSSYPSLNPWCKENNSEDKDYLTAFDARAYEMIYNSFYRNSHGNQPFVVDGDTKYNEYLPSDAGDADNYRYVLHKRNWELDAYTSCMPSPQQGNAPLVGVTLDGTIQVRHEDGSVSTAQLRDLQDGQGIEVVRSNIANAEDARTIISMASSGMTIADFRQGNALQRFLEQSLRSGFRYADFIYGHFGKSPSHQELDMPVFLGGYTQIIDVNKVTNVTASEDAKLGQFAGSAASFGSSSHKIHHYFDDYGVVMGLMMLVPDPAYSQILPKHFLYRNRLDFYFPQFAQLGLQPINYSEICPVQSHAEFVAGDTSHKLTDTFGYQRPNHELVWIPDSVHGLFRTSLSGSVIQRRFSTRPELSDEFLTINPNECNDIFSVIEDDDDTWIGQIVVDIKAKRPVPHVVVPSLGR